MVKVDVYTRRTWTQDRASYRIGSSIAALVAGSIALFFQFLTGLAAVNYGLALASLFLVLVGLFSTVIRPKLDDYYRVAPRPPLRNRPMLAAVGSLIGFFAIGITQKIVIAKELSSVLLSSTNPVGDIAILGGSGISENLFIDYLLFSVLFAALLISIGNYAVSVLIAQGTAATTAWVFHFGVYGLDPSYFIFVFTSFLNMGILWWLFGSVLSVIVIHVWWNIGALVASLLALPSLSLPLIGTVDPILLGGVLTIALVAFAEANSNA
jgi:hypothetical protein